MELSDKAKEYLANGESYLENDDIAGFFKSLSGEDDADARKAKDFLNIYHVFKEVGIDTSAFPISLPNGQESIEVILRKLYRDYNTDVHDGYLLISDYFNQNHTPHINSKYDYIDHEDFAKLCNYIFDVYYITKINDYIITLFRNRRDVIESFLNNENPFRDENDKISSSDIKIYKKLLIGQL